MVDYGLKDKVVLITGANNPLGIGAVCAKMFAKQGAKVAIAYKVLDYNGEGDMKKPGLHLYHTMRARNADKALENIGENCIAIEGDLLNEDSIISIFNEVENKLGPVDILINNAAHYEEEDTIFNVSGKGIDKTFGVMTKGMVLMCQEFIKRYEYRNGSYGRIVNLSTDAAQNFAGQITYGASKAAIESLTRSIAREIGYLGITINTVAPGPTQTGWIDEELEEICIKDTPLSRLGKPEDIGNTILFLASKQAEWITGQVIKVSGGHNV